MNLILIAPPAAGKGTMASMLNKKYNLVCISAGELLRGVDPSTELGKKIREIQSRRELVDDSITNELMKERLMKDDVKGGFILDGYPRHMPQVTAINNICDELGLHIDYAVLLNVSYDMALKRTLGRQICPQCKKTYNRLTGVNTPKVEGMCDECNVPLITRNDDNEETFKIRYDEYMNNTKPVVDYFNKINRLGVVNVTDNLEETLLQVEKYLEV